MKDGHYHQYCGLAHALELVGDRWALLIVRNLLLGPRRFLELRRGLPGIASNILAARLRDLEAGGVIARRDLPAGGAAYELTPYGRALEEPLLGLARWGFATLGPPRSDLAATPESVLLVLRRLLAGPARLGIDLACEVRLEGPSYSGVFALRLREGAVAEAWVGAADDPDLVLRSDLATVAGLAGDAETLAGAIARGAVRLDGDADAVARWTAPEGPTYTIRFWIDWGPPACLWPAE